MTDLTRLGGGKMCVASQPSCATLVGSRKCNSQKKKVFSDGKTQSPSTHKGAQTCTFEDHQNLREQERGRSGGPAEEMKNNSKNLKKSLKKNEKYKTKS